MSHSVVGHEGQIVTSMTGAVRVVRVTGSLDRASASSFRDGMRDDWAEERLIVDLGHLSGCDSAGTGAVRAAVARAQHRGQHMVIVTVDPLLVGLLSRLGPSIAIVSSTAQAWRLLCAGPPR